MIFSFAPKYRKWNVALSGICSGISSARTAWYSAVLQGLNGSQELAVYKPFPSFLYGDAEAYALAFQQITVLDFAIGRGYVSDQRARAEFMFHLIAHGAGDKGNSEGIYRRYLGSDTMKQLGEFTLVEHARAPLAIDISLAICPNSPSVVAPIIERLAADLSFLTMIVVADEFGDKKGVGEIQEIRLEWAKTVRCRS